MLLYEEFINEAKQVGVIYHYTSIDSMFSILNDGNINPSYPEYGKYFISFTRDKNFLMRNFNMISSIVNCRLVFDGNKISNNFKLEPYNYYVNKPKMLSKRGSSDYSNEQEERLYLKSGSSKFPVLKYIIRIELLKKYIEDVFKNKTEDKTVFKYYMKNIASFLDISIDELVEMNVNEFVSEIVRVVSKKYNVKVVLV